MIETIFITGGGSGIGRAIAQRFAREGWRVGLADIDERGLAETAALLPSGVVTYAMDVRDRAAWTSSLADFTERAGGLGVLANNAGIALGGPFAEADPADIDRTVAINLTGVMTGAQVAYPYLKDSGGCLLTTASASAIYGSAGLAVYSITKFGVRALTEALDAEWAADGVRVRSLMPGFIDTPLLATAVAGTNRSARDHVVDAGLEFTPIERVADAAWQAVHGERLHTPVGPTARRLMFAARWMPGRLRAMMKRRVLGR